MSCSVCLAMDRPLACICTSFEVCLLLRSLQWCVHARTIISGLRELVLSAVATFLSLSLSAMLHRPPTHGVCSGRHLVMSPEAPLVCTLSLHVQADSGATQKTEQYRTETAVFSPKTDRPQPA